jgi:nucleotide-binding universal stress UspA family protein
MAGSANAMLHCIYVVEEPQVYTTLDMGAVAIPTTGEMVESAEKRMQVFVSQHLKNTPHGHASKVRVGHPSTEIVAYASEVHAEMIVMTTHGYRGVKHVLLGSTAEDVLRRATCPVLTVRAQS